MGHRDFVEKLYSVRNEPDMLNAIIMRERASLPPEPRTCETCAEYGRDDADCNGDRTGMECIDRSNWKAKTPRSPQAADVEMVREALKDYYNIGIVECSDEITIAAEKALAALDRIAGKEE